MKKKGVIIDNLKTSIHSFCTTSSILESMPLLQKYILLSKVALGCCHYEDCILKQALLFMHELF
jgi:hypothetical protein